MIYWPISRNFAQPDRLDDPLGTPLDGEEQERERPIPRFAGDSAHKTPQRLGSAGNAANHSTPEPLAVRSAAKRSKDVRSQGRDRIRRLNHTCRRSLLPYNFSTVFVCPDAGPGINLAGRAPTREQQGETMSFGSGKIWMNGSLVDY